MKSFEAKRIQNMPTSIFTTISQLAFEHKAVNLGQGFPDFDGAAWLKEKAFEAMQEGKNQYAPTAGIMSFRQNIANVEKQLYGIDWNPASDITVTAGATEGLFSTIHAFIETGDEVILFEPFYDGYDADVLLAGGKPVYVTLHKPDFSFDPDELKKAITTKTKMIILNTPHNPTGKVFGKKELQIIADLAIEYDLLVLSDEVYEYMIYDTKHIPIATLDGMKERTISISSTGKTFGMTGWKMGYVKAVPELTKAVQSVHQWTTFAVNTPGQHAMAYAFSIMDEYLPEFRKTYQAKRDLLLNGLKDTAFTPMKPDGSYFIMVDIPEQYKDDVDACMRLIKEYGVATIPPSAFYQKSEEGKSMLRLCFAKEDDTLYKGIEKLKAASK